MINLALIIESAIDVGKLITSAEIPSVKPAPSTCGKGPLQPGRPASGLRAKCRELRDQKGKGSEKGHLLGRDRLRAKGKAKGIRTRETWGTERLSGEKALPLRPMESTTIGREGMGTVSTGPTASLSMKDLRGGKRKDPFSSLLTAGNSKRARKKIVSLLINDFKDTLFQDWC